MKTPLETRCPTPNIVAEGKKLRVNMSEAMNLNSFLPDVFAIEI